MKPSSSWRTFGAQLLADPSAPRRWLSRFSLSGDGTLISCILADGLITLPNRGRTGFVRVDGPSLSTISKRLVLRLGEVHVHAPFEAYPGLIIVAADTSPGSRSLPVIEQNLSAGLTDFRPICLETAKNRKISLRNHLSTV